MRLLPRWSRVGLVALVLAVTATATMPSTADAFLRALGKAVVQTVSLGIRRGNDYERLEAHRDQEIADVQVRRTVAEEHRRQGWIDGDALVREQGRYDAQAEAITARTEREKRITRDTYGRAAGVIWRDAAVSALVQVHNVDPRIAQTVVAVSRGEHPVNAAMDAVVQQLVSGDLDASTDSVTALEAQWESTRSALRAVRLPGAVSLEARLRNLVQHSQRIRNDRGALGEALFQEELGQLRSAASETQALITQARSVIDEWTLTGVRMQPDRFTRDQRWQRLNAEVAALEGPTAARALMAGMIRSADARISALIVETGVSLSPDALDELVVRIARESLADRVAAEQAGGTIFDATLDETVRRAVNEALAAAGQDPLPEATPVVVQDIPSTCPESLGTRPRITEAAQYTAFESGGARWRCGFQLALGEGPAPPDFNAVGQIIVEWVEPGGRHAGGSDYCVASRFREDVSPQWTSYGLVVPHPTLAVRAMVGWAEPVGISRAEAEAIAADYLAIFASRATPCE